MIAMPLIEDDKRYISDLYRVIRDHRAQMKASLMPEMSNYNKSQNIDYIHGCRKVPDRDIEKRKEEKSYSWYSRSCMDMAIQEFFSSDYVCRRLAKASYVFDEGDTFEEEWTCECPLGRVKNEHGISMETSTARFVMLVRPFGKYDKTTGMPFRVIACQLVPDAEEE